MRAADGDNVKVGAANIGSNTTEVRVSTASFSALWGNAPATTGTGVGVRGDSDSASGTGVWGRSPNIGVKGEGGYGVKGAGYYGVYGDSDSGMGVFGHGPVGVYGVGSGSASSGSTGVWAVGSSGAALRVSGRAVFQHNSGVATVAAGQTNVAVTPGCTVNAKAFVLLTPRANLGGRDLWYTLDAAANKITIRLSSTRSTATPIAWLLLG